MKNLFSAKTTVEFSDSRDGLLGNPPIFDCEAMGLVVKDFDPHLPTVRVRTELPTPEQVDAQHPGYLHTDEDGTPVIILFVSDRLTYSDKSVARVSRNYVRLLRVLGVYADLKSVFTSEVADMVFGQSLQVIDAEAYALAKVWCESHDSLPVKVPAE